MAGYSASKYAVVGLTKSAAKEAGTRNIRINAVAPGKLVLSGYFNVYLIYFS